MSHTCLLYTRGFKQSLRSVDCVPIAGESVFMASMMTVESTNVPRGRGSKDKEEEKFDPTKPNDHPLLKVRQCTV